VVDATPQHYLTDPINNWVFTDSVPVQVGTLGPRQFRFELAWKLGLDKLFPFAKKMCSFHDKKLS